jgi:hypothetical protein
MRRLTAGWVAAAFAGGLGLAGVPTFVETFDGGSNAGGWTFGGPGGGIQAAGGNPGAYLSSGLLDTFAPQPRTTQAGSPFTGNYRERGVTSFGVDLVTFQAMTTGGRPLTLMLIHDNDTPGVFADDTAAYFMGPNIPHVGQGWVSYDYGVPSQETALPAGWLLLNLGNLEDPPLHTWDDVIQHVDVVRLFYGDPTFVFIFQQWFLGLDNPRITQAPCAAGAGAVPDGAHVPGTMLRIRKASGGNIRLSWGASCNGCDSDYGVYEGQLGDWDSHTLRSCTSGGLLAQVIAPDAGSAYYLVVPSDGRREGSYGRTSGGDERPPGVAACFPQQHEPCP